MNEKSISTTEISPQDDDEFEPQIHSDPETRINFFAAAIHIIKYTMGYGMLALPLVHRKLGYLVASVLTLMAGVLYYHIIHILVDLEYSLCKLTRKPRLTFIEVVQMGFQNTPSLVRILLGSIIQLMVHLYYFIPIGNAAGVIIMSSNVQIICKYLQVEISLTQAINLVIVPTFLLSVCIRKVKWLVPFSAITNIFTVIIVCIIFAHSIFSHKPESKWKPINDLTFLSEGFAVVIGALSATGIFIPLKGEMKSPSSFFGVLGVVNVAGSALILLYICFGAICYRNYGDAVKDNVIMNLPDNTLFSVAVYALYVPALMVNHSLSLYSKCDIYWTGMLKRKVNLGRCEILGEYGMRLFFNAFTYILAVCIPNFGLFNMISGTIGIICDIAVPPFLELLMLLYGECCTLVVVLKIVKNLMIVGVACILFGMSAVGCWYSNN